MSAEIVRRLMGMNKKSLQFLKESSDTHLYEEEEDDKLEDEETTEVEDETVEDTETEETETPEEDTTEESPSKSFPRLNRTPEDSSEEDTPSGDEEYVDPEGSTELELDADPEEETTQYINPLDNVFAVKHTIGDEVLLAYSNGTSSKLKGEVAGYDKEGFYRIRWANGLTTNGITDLALADLVSKKNENNCVCGSTEFVTEGKYVVCDRCGRRIRESADPLTKADRSRPKGKKLIRSEAHPVSTTLSESSSLGDLDQLKGQFWTRLSELVEDIEDLGYEVLDYNSEYVVIAYEDDEGDQGELQIFLGGTSRTMTLDFNRTRFTTEMDIE